MSRGLILIDDLIGALNETETAGLIECVV